MMTRRERLMASLQGLPVDRPPVSFYEIGGYTINPDDPDPFNVYNDPSWRPLLTLAENHTDLMRFGHLAVRPSYPELHAEFWTHETRNEGASRFYLNTLQVAGRTMTEQVRRDAAVYTSWTTEHLLRSVEDVEAYLQLPDELFAEMVDVTAMARQDEQLGDRGIVMVDTADPLCIAASLFSMEDFTVLAFSEPALFHRLLGKVAAPLYKRTEAVAQAFPGHLWRICGPEYATSPYLPPDLFGEYVVEYDRPMVQAIQATGGFVRIHCHGNLAGVLPHIAALNADGLDPIEPPPQGDVHLADVRREYGQQMTLFGNLEASDIENLDPGEFESAVSRALDEGTGGAGRGFVLMPSASPYGRQISENTLANYTTLVRLAKGRAGSGR